MLIIIKNNTKLSPLIEVNNLLAVVRWGWGWPEEKTKKEFLLKNMHILNNATWKFNPVFICSSATSGYKEVLSLTVILQIAVVIHRVLFFALLTTYGYSFKLIFCLSAGKGTEKTTADYD